MRTALSVAKLKDTGRHWVYEGILPDSCPDMIVLFILEGETGTLKASRHFATSLDACLEANDLTRDSIFNILDVEHLIPPPRYA